NAHGKPAAFRARANAPRGGGICPRHDTWWTTAWLGRSCSPSTERIAHPSLGSVEGRGLVISPWPIAGMTTNRTGSPTFQAACTDASAGGRGRKSSYLSPYEDPREAERKPFDLEAGTSRYGDERPVHESGDDRVTEERRSRAAGHGRQALELGHPRTVRPHYHTGAFLSAYQSRRPLPLLYLASCEKAYYYP